jgi:hypothetical protein
MRPYIRKGRHGAPLRRVQRSYFFFAAFFFAPLAAFFAIEIPPFVRWIGLRAVSPIDPAHSAAWHVGPGVSDLAS